MRDKEQELQKKIDEERNSPPSKQRTQYYILSLEDQWKMKRFKSVEARLANLNHVSIYELIKGNN